MNFASQQGNARSATTKLVALFLLACAGTVWAVARLTQWLWSITLKELPWPENYSAYCMVACLFIIASGYIISVMRMRSGGSDIAHSMGANEIDHGQANAKRVLNIIQETSLAAGMKAPKVYVLESDAINAFAAGWSKRDGIVCLSTGAIAYLNRDELHGVVAHEFSHILNGDMRLNMHLTCMVYGLECICDVGFQLLRFSDSRSRKISLFQMMGIAMVTAGSLGWIAGRLLQAAISRQREYLADASAVQFTRLSGGIGGALRKIAHQQKVSSTFTRLESSAGQQLSHMFFSPLAFPGSSWLSTHPSIERRIERLYGRSVTFIEPIFEDAGEDETAASVEPIQDQVRN